MRGGRCVRRGRITNSSRILMELHNRAMSDQDLADATGIPLPSVRRDRLHLLATGAVLLTDEGLYRARQPWEHPAPYTGRQAL